MATGNDNKKTPTTQIIASVAQRVDEIKRSALLTQTKKELLESPQMSLFDLAPWSDAQRGLPNDLARSAIFTTRNKKVPREALQNMPIFSIGKDVTITYTGLELRADDDELVFLQVYEYAKRNKPIGGLVRFTLYQFCNDLGWQYDTKYRKMIEMSLTRLQATAFKISSNRMGRLESVSFINEFRILNKGTRNARCEVKICPEMVFLFAGDHYSKFFWDGYKKLTPTSRRLFDYFSSHRQPFPISILTFRDMCGSSARVLRSWRKQVRDSCEELVALKLVKNAWVEKDKIFCEK